MHHQKKLLVASFTKWDGMSTEEVYSRCGIDVRTKVAECRAVEWVKCISLMKSGNFMRIKSVGFVKSMHELNSRAWGGRKSASKVN